MITEQTDLTTRPELYQMLELIDKAKDEDVVPLVKDLGSKYTSFTDYLRCVFDDKIQFLLPEGKPPYRPADVPATSWHKVHMDLAFWVKGLKGENSNPIRREQIFINALEGVHAEDALILVDMIAKKTPSKKLTKEVAVEAFPNFFKK